LHCPFFLDLRLNDVISVILQCNTTKIFVIYMDTHTYDVSRYDVR